MKKGLLIVLLAFLLVPFMGAREDVKNNLEPNGLVVPTDDPEKISLSRSGGWEPYRSMHPVVKVLSDGNIMVAWEEGESEAHCNIVYRFLDTKTNQWNPPLDQLPKVAANRAFSCTFPQIVEDGDGAIHIIYQDGVSQPTRDIWHTVLRDGKWTQQMILRDSVNSAWPRATLDPETGDIYATWQVLILHPDGIPYVFGDSEIGFSVLHKGASAWTNPARMFSYAYLNYQENPVRGSITIHQSTAWANGQLHGLFMDGLESAWKIAGQSMPRNGHPVHPGPAPVMIQDAGYWPELEADSKGNLIGVYSFRNGGTAWCYKPVGGEWQAKPVIGPGVADFMGLAIGKNDIAYAINKTGYADGFLPVAIRFSNEVVSPTIQVDSTSRYPIRTEIDVDDNGDIHCVWTDRRCNDWVTDSCATSVWYRKISQEPGGPTVAIEDVPATIITKEAVNFSGKVTKSSSSIKKHTWYNHKLALWQSGQNLNYTFQSPGFYTIHYYVADAQNRMGHTSITVEVIDAPFQPTEASVSDSLIRGFFLRRYINELNWKTDPRNDGKFENLTHFNIYRRRAGESDWGTPYTTLDYVDSDTTYNFRDEKPGFATEEEAAEWQYAVTVVANVSGSDKESKKTIFARN
ncbi:MAG: PKD domain-containing protein [Acidobacteriota bacterium]|jgi:hypothetical protein|nr:PKD domain-containing protein [Acidobacteriota bacterium]